MSFWHEVCFWGAHETEIEGAWPCDALGRPDEFSIFRAIDVDAESARVFRWLCQLKVAPYSYDWLDNAGRQSPRRLTEGADHLEVGQRLMSLFELIDFETDRFMTLATRGSRFLAPIIVTYQTLPRPCSQPHSEGTRLIARLRMAFPRHSLGQVVQNCLCFGDWIMMRKQFLTLKALAEAESRNEP
jgi:hypothetical protein